MIKYIDEYRDKALVNKIVSGIKKISHKEIVLMEVCGGHTMAIQKFGIPSLLPPNIRLVSGPGCPVCVTNNNFIDHALQIGKNTDAIITTFGDLIRVPGNLSSLEKGKAKGMNVRVVYSSLDAIEIAKQNPDKTIVFLGIGFETTAPTSAAAILFAKAQGITNFKVLSSHKIMPPAMKALINEGVKINGYICPGHVSTITGSEIYRDIAEVYHKSCVIAGFEPTDILLTVYMLAQQIENNISKVEIQYKRAVKPEGNLKAKALMNEVFELHEDWWRGLGNIPASGLKIKEKYKEFDANTYYPMTNKLNESTKGCICGEILKGMKTPKDCKLFKKTCTPSNPVGACMVSGEGACQAYYKYN